MTKEQLEKLKLLKQEQKTKSKDKKFNTMSATEKWELVECMAKMLGLIQ